MTHLTMGIDIGTYETKGVLADESGQVVAQAARPHRMEVPHPGWAEHDPETVWWDDVVHVCGTLLSEAKVDGSAVAALGLSAIGPCVLPVDANGDPLSQGVLYGVDTRAAAQVDRLNERIGAARVNAFCGNPLTSQSTGPKVLWFRDEHPEIYERAACFHTSTGFVVERLTGERVIDAYTAANMAPYYDAATGAWSTQLDDSIDIARLPTILPSTAIAGRVTARAAEATGLAQGTPVLTGTIDAAAEALSVGVTRARDAMVMYGSTIFIIQQTAARVDDPAIWYAPWLFEGDHAAMAGQTTAGTLTHWFRERFARELPREEAFPILTAEAAESPPGARGLTVLPNFSGVATPLFKPQARGLIDGLDLTHTRGDLFRAFLEGIALGTAHVAETFRAAQAAPERVFAVGGGTRNDVWMQATSDATGLTQTVRERTVGASLGDALLAAIALDRASRETIEKWNPVARTVEPNPDHADLYAARLARAKHLFEAAL